MSTIGHGDIEDYIKVLPGGAAADISTEVVGPYVSAANYRDLTGVLVSSGGAIGDVLTVRLIQATSSAGAGAKTLASTAFTATATGAQLVATSAHVAAMDHANGFVFVAVGVDSSAIDPGAGVLLAGGQRFAP